MKVTFLEDPLAKEASRDSALIQSPNRYDKSPQALKNEITPKLQLNYQCDTIMEYSSSDNSLLVQVNFDCILAQNSLKFELQELQQTVKQTQMHVKMLETKYKEAKASIRRMNQQILQWERDLCGRPIQ
ncbi:hypothetical protein SS50377_28584 [Spironucleus salmonicida]|uniref:Uncharacterized protein n=1 Tax=Spironucleus salmonicida TaxID=348837 RepID=V6LB00_9EUKA|nr:hypothetical protein SS50377_28584 [Spironucleus salmonicida]|eukprot:EST41592.1 Hypothetical protein SS50377_18933 [Spironucleus salmonicida]